MIRRPSCYIVSAAHTGAPQSSPGSTTPADCVPEAGLRAGADKFAADFGIVVVVVGADVGGGDRFGAVAGAGAITV